MAIGDRVLTPATARALLSWRIVLGAVIGLVAALLGMGAGPAAGLGLAVYAATVVAGITAPVRTTRTTIDPFALSEPWRRFVQHAQRSRVALHDTLHRASEGPLKDRLADVAVRLDGAIEESWEIAKRGDEIDDAINRIDPVRLRSQLETLRAAGDMGGDSTAAAVESVQNQLASTDRLKALSARTAERLQLTQARLDELVARAAEVSVGRTDTATYEHDVDNLVIELEALRQAVAETNELR